MAEGDLADDPTITKYNGNDPDGDDEVDIEKSFQDPVDFIDDISDEGMRDINTRLSIVGLV